MTRTSNDKLFSFHGLLTNHIYILYYLICSLFFISSSRSEVFTVGDDSLWVEGFDYHSWAAQYTYHVGDILEFKYGVKQHNVYEVTQATYQSCNASTGVLAKYNTGDDMIPLNELRLYWFICNVDEHCLGGMRFGVNVTNATRNSSSSSPPISSTSNQTPPPPGSGAVKGKRGRISFVDAGILLVITKFIL